MRLHHGIEALLPAYLDPYVIDGDDDDEGTTQTLTRAEWYRVNDRSTTSQDANP